jgi:hypothetical protein
VAPGACQLPAAALLPALNWRIIVYFSHVLSAVFTVALIRDYHLDSLFYLGKKFNLWPSSFYRKFLFSLLNDCLVTFIERDIFFKVDEDDIVKTSMSLRKRRIK